MVSQMTLPDPFGLAATALEWVAVLVASVMRWSPSGARVELAIAEGPDEAFHGRKVSGVIMRTVDARTGGSPRGRTNLGMVLMLDSPLDCQERSTTWIALAPRWSGHGAYRLRLRPATVDVFCMDSPEDPPGLWSLQYSHCIVRAAAPAAARAQAPGH